MCKKVICTSFARLFVPNLFNQSHKNILISRFTINVGVRLTIKVCTWNVERAHGVYMLSIKVCTWNVTYAKCQSECVHIIQAFVLCIDMLSIKVRTWNLTCECVVYKLPIKVCTWNGAQSLCVQPVNQSTNVARAQAGANWQSSFTFLLSYFLPSLPFTLYVFLLCSAVG